MATMIPCMSTSTTDVKGESIASVLLGQVDIFLRYLQFVLMSRYEASLQNAFFEEFDVGQAMRVALCVQVCRLCLLSCVVRLTPLFFVFTVPLLLQYVGWLVLFLIVNTFYVFLLF